MLPQVNARLLAIYSGGTAEDWDQAAGPGTPKWQGDGDAYVQEKMRTALPATSGSLARTKDTSIVISSGLTDVSGNPLTIESGDVFTYTFMGVTHHRVVADENSAYLPSLAVQQYVRIHFNNEAPEIALETE